MIVSCCQKPGPAAAFSTPLFAIPQIFHNATSAWNTDRACEERQRDQLLTSLRRRFFDP
jgi:hypothetical protein